ncbi:MAG: OpgC domain-containing protein [Thalassovita sp.]
MRFDVLDGVRGHLLFMMMLAHLGWQPGLSNLFLLHHSQIIVLLDAEFLVFLSGLLVGILYAMKFKGPQKLAVFLTQRLGKIYRFYLWSAVPFLALALAQDVRGVSFLWAIVEVFLIQNGGAFSDILPIYLFCFVLLLGGTFVLRRGPVPWLLLPSVALYCVSLFNYDNGVFGLGAKFLIFDLAAWQLVFFIAFVLGAYYQQIGAWVAGLSDRTYLALFVTFACLTVLQRWALFYTPITELPPEVTDYWYRMHLHPVHLLRMMIVVVFFALVAMRSVRVTRPFTAVLQWYFTLPLLRYCGMYAIQMFVIHVYIIGAFSYFQAGWGSSEKMIAAIFVQLAYMALPLLLRCVFTRNIWQCFRNLRSSDKAD